MSWETPKFKDISLAMECSSYSNTDDFEGDETSTDPTFDF
ncbi:MAG: pyrroloquinoline quinone precursor peptide PqqA [Candidatus Hydrogenedentota bacterium]|nr:MAG: pyrroloquinoline quinone precursor peptide PqqA [Candidatus Hydrogenedentota bacterium]